MVLESWRILLIPAALIRAAVMIIHPSDAHGGALILSYVVHALAIASTFVIFFGAINLAQRLGLMRTAILLGLVLFGAGAVATLLAGTINGFVAPKFIAVLDAGKMAREDVTAIASLSWWLNQALANLHAVADGAAILLWSLAWPGRGYWSAALRLFGLVAGAAILIALPSGMIAMDVHGAALVAIALALWLIGAAILAPRRADASQAA